MKKILRMLCLLFLTCNVFIWNGCSNRQQSPAATNQTATQNAATQTQKEEPDTLSNNYPIRYEGILPSADTPKVKTILCISIDYTHFRLAEKNTVGDANTRITEEGHMNTERGYGKDDNATVYILNDNEASKRQYAMVRKTGSDDLLLCDSNRKVIGPTFILKKLP